MKYLLRVLLSLAVVGVGSALAEEPQATPPTGPPAAAPPQAAPTQVPAPPASVQPSDQQQPAAQAQSPAVPPGVPAGQWVYTGQYGWVWMPHAQSYTYVPDYGDPYMYVYDPVYSWRWVAAPWVFGWGPSPYWGSWGVSRYTWYSRPWFSSPASRAYGGYGAYHSGYRGYAAPSYGGYRGGYSGHAYGGVGYHGGPAVHPALPVQQQGTSTNAVQAAKRKASGERHR